MTSFCVLRSTFNVLQYHNLQSALISLAFLSQYAERKKGRGLFRRKSKTPASGLSGQPVDVCGKYRKTILKNQDIFL
jgi:hypothetical protein